MDDLIAEINKTVGFSNSFCGRNDKTYADDIIYIETELHKMYFYTEKGTFQIYKNWMNWKMNSMIWDSCGHI